MTSRPLPTWLPSAVLGPFLAYESLVSFLLSRWRRMPARVRFGNAFVETSLPTAIIWTISHYSSPETGFEAWPQLLYFVFIVAATLRLNFALPAFTGLVAAVEYLTLAWIELPLASTNSTAVLNPFNHTIKAALMLLAGVVAGLVARRLREKFFRAVEEAAARERVTNLFGQHVSPAVVDQLLDRPDEFGGATRDICVMFLDIRDFTANSRGRAPGEVVDFLNRAFAFMIEAVDRHGGFINKFLGDGFMAVFGAPLADADSVPHAVAAARDILAEVDRQTDTSGWPLRIGIGLHAGPAVTGNVGSPRRKEFTAIGDTVNLAARMEQLNKEFGSRLLVSEAVMKRLPQAPAEAVALGGVSVKGYDQPMTVWRLD
jgi:adenylate cyclase